MRWSISLATACHPASRNPATAGAQESACSFCGQLHIFSPPRKNVAAPKSGLSPAPPQAIRSGQGQRERLQGRRGRGRRARWGGSYQLSAPWRGGGKQPLQKRRPQHCWGLCRHFRKKENPEQIWRGFHRAVIAVLFKDVTATPPTEHNSGGNGASFEVSQSQPTPEQNKPRILNKHSRVGLSPWLPGTSLLSTKEIILSSR